MNISDEIDKLARQKADGILTEEEFASAKAKLVEPSVAPRPSSSGKPFDVNQWSMFIHLSQLAGYITAGAGFILPIVLWQIKKEESPVIDAHGKAVTNWLISSLIYAAVCVGLMFVIIGVFLLPVLIILSLVFTIVGTLKANEGEVWKYPLSIQFFK